MERAKDTRVLGGSRGSPRAVSFRRFSGGREIPPPEASNAKNALRLLFFAEFTKDESTPHPSPSVTPSPREGISRKLKNASLGVCFSTAPSGRRKQGTAFV